MRRWQKITAIVAVGALALGVAAYLNRSALVLAYVGYSAEREVAKPRAIDWQQGPIEADAPIGERPPNIVFILVDDLGINDISAFGGGVAGGAVPTPNIDRLAAQGALFQQAYSGTGTCAPSRAMLMTGRYPTRTGFEFTPMPSGMGSVVNLVSRDIRPDLPEGIFDSDLAATKPPYEEQGLPSGEVTIAETLKARGYHTVHIGKWHLGRSDGSAPNDQGFDESLLMDSGLYLPEDHPDVVNARLAFDPIDHFLWEAMQFSASFNGGELFEPGGYLTDYWTDEAVKVIEANRNRPFFLYLAHWGVHTPLQATREDYEAVGDITPHRLRVYAAMVRSLDRSVGQIMAKLEEEGLADDTIIVFSSDNGGAGYVGLPEVNAPYRGWKITLFEGGIRVPLFVRWPREIAAGQRLNAPVAHIDVMPTLAAAAGADLPKGVAIDGVNLLPAMQSDGAIERKDDAIFWQSGHYQVVRAGNWKLQINGHLNRKWLFDLANDPTEQVNLILTRPDKLAELEALLTAHQAGRVPPLYPAVTGTPMMIDKSLAEQFEQGDEFVYWPN